MTPIKPEELFNTVSDEELGFRPVNFSIKPVHVANGLVRSLTGRTYTTEPLTKTLRRHVRNQKLGVDQEKNPNEAVLSSYAEAFESLDGSGIDQQRLNLLRALMLSVFNADSAVFNQQDKSSFTFSNERFVTKDPSDNRAGLFLSRLLTAAPKAQTHAANHLKDLLQSERDAWTTLALPLLELGSVREEKDGKASELAAKSDYLFESSDGALRSPTLRALRDCYDRLSEFERTAGSKINSLRRLVLFGCFVLHVHLISRWSERESSAPRPPILLDLFDGSLPSVRDASRATLRAAGDAIEGLFRACFLEHVAENYGESREEILSQLEEQPETRDCKAAFDNLSRGGMDPREALAQSLVDRAFSSLKEHPLGSAIELGRRAGFLSPWSNQGSGGKLRKRYTATAEFLEVLVAATVEPDDPQEFPEFLDALSRNLGVVVGRPEDDDLIRRNNLDGGQFGPPTAVNEEDLRRNVERMRELVIETGYAKAYADGRTIITTIPEGKL